MSNITWQNVMEATKAAADKHKAVYFTWLRKANAMDAVEDRSLLNQPYSGTPISQWPLTAQERAEVQAQLDKMTLSNVHEPAGYTWRNVMDAAKSVAEKHHAKYFTWLRQANAMDAADDRSLLDQPYTGPSIAAWPLSAEQRAEIQSLLVKVEPKRPSRPNNADQIKLNVPYISQEDSSASSHTGDCGPTCLAMIINAESPPAEQVTVDWLYQKYLPNQPVKKFTTSEQMLSMGQHGGLRTRRKDYNEGEALESLRKMIRAGRPVIALVNYAVLTSQPNQAFAHFVVVTGIDHDHIFVHDPLYPVVQQSQGKFHKWANDQFLKGWGSLHKIKGSNANYSTYEVRKVVSILPD
jgi:hypothetical protein